MKVLGLFLMELDFIPRAYGPAEQAELHTLVDFVAPPLAPAEWGTSAVPVEEVTALYSGWGMPAMNEAFLARFRSLRVVFHAAGTVKPFVSEALWRRGVQVTCAASMNAIPVAEFTLSQIIFCLKQGWHRVREVREERRFVRDDDLTSGANGSTVGLLSLSRTGRIVAKRLQTLDVRVIAYDPIIAPEDATALGVELCALDEVMARADIVSCHTPLLPETTRMIRGRHFALMKRGAAFINTARGLVVHEPEMINALRRRPDLFAVLDVTEAEPPPPQSPLFSLPNVVLTPHLAGSVGLECRRLGRMMVAETRRYLSGAQLVGEVRPEQLPFLA